MTVRGGGISMHATSAAVAGSRMAGQQSWATISPQYSRSPTIRADRRMWVSVGGRNGRLRTVLPGSSSPSRRRSTTRHQSNASWPLGQRPPRAPRAQPFQRGSRTVTVPATDHRARCRGCCLRAQADRCALQTGKRHQDPYQRQTELMARVDGLGSGHQSDLRRLARLPERLELARPAHQPIQLPHDDRVD